MQFLIFKMLIVDMRMGNGHKQLFQSNIRKSHQKKITINIKSFKKTTKSNVIPLQSKFLYQTLSTFYNPPHIIRTNHATLQINPIPTI
jgi:hypothetical protein